MGYNLMVVVSDDNQNIYQAAKKIFPCSTSQLCHVHYLRNIKYDLELDQFPHYAKFFKSVKSLFITKRSTEDFDKRARGILKSYMTDEKSIQIMLDIERRKSLLLGYHSGKRVPVTTNLIEGYNSHLEDRLQRLKGFESFKHAKLWLNAYFLRRRTKKFTDCRGKFKRLNGTTSLEEALTPGIKIPNFF